MCFAPQRRTMSRRGNFQKLSNPAVFCAFGLGNVLRATTACTFSKSGPAHFDFEMCFAPQQRTLFRRGNFQKLSNPAVLCTFGLGNVLRATTACTFSKNGPNLVCFAHFDFEMCFALQRRALFHHLNFPKCSGNGVCCTFWLGNVLRATTPGTFPPSQLPKVLRKWCALYILTSKCASRQNGVQFFISHLARWLHTHRFSEPTFRPSRDTNHWKNAVFYGFSAFRAPPSSFLWLFLFSDLLFSSLLFWLFRPLLFHVPLLSEIWLVNFLRLIYGKGNICFSETASSPRDSSGNENCSRS